MPIYDFKCECCNKVVEKITPSSVEAIECPNCGSASRRVVSGSQSFYLKGEGVHCEKSMYPRKK